MVSKIAATVITANTRFPPSRRPARDKTAAEARYVRHVGEIIHAWNQAHGALFHVFSVVAANEKIDVAYALWHSHSGDKAQRAMLDALVRVKYPKPGNSIRSGIMWALAALDTMGTHRNDAAHAQIISGHTDIIPGMSVKSASAVRLEISPLAQHWRVMRGDLYAIENYLDAIYLALWNDFPRPLSQRPKLQFVHNSSAKTQQKRRLAKKTKSGTPPLSSRA